MFFLFIFRNQVPDIPMENAEEIIVYASFDSAIDGSLAKAKLDAFGIPCFLTEENMSSLYPGQQNFAIQVRLHIFKKDIEEISGILMNVESSHDAADLHCPKCSSKKIEREFPKRLLVEPLSSLIVMFFGVFFPEKKISHCLDCDNEF